MAGTNTDGQTWTPGPWRLSRTGRYVMDTHAAPWVAEVTQRPEAAANANLLAAAPDLYDALAALLQYIDDHDWGTIPEGETGDRARAALAKAEGRAA